MIRRAFLFAALLIQATNSSALSSPTLKPLSAYPLKHNGQVIYLHGDPSATITCAPLDLCLVALQPGERIKRDGMHIGDSIRWQVKPTVGANETTHVVLKPLAPGLETSLALVTDRRSYHMRLVSQETGSMPLVAFHYPDEVSEAWSEYYEERAQAEERRRLPETEEDISTLDFDYTINGCSSCTWRPRRVYNNGKLTILHMGPGIHQGETPTLLVQSPQGDVLVNYRIQSDRYIVDRVFDRAVLVLGVGRNQERVTVARKSRTTAEVFPWLD